MSEVIGQKPQTPVFLDQRDVEIARLRAENGALKKTINTIQTIRMADEAEITRLKEKIAKFIYEENPDSIDTSHE